MNQANAEPLANLAAGKPADSGQFLLGRRLRLVEPLLGEAREHLVDFGCGNGAQTRLFDPLFARTTGVDVDPVFLAEFQAQIVADGVQDRTRACELVDGRIPLDDACADVVTSFTVLEHVPDEAAALAEMRRVLRPGGRMIISVPNRWWLFETHGADLPLLPWNRVPLVSWWPKRLHDRWARARIYRRREIVAMVSAAGFTVTGSWRATAPMDMIKWAPLRRVVRGVFFGRDRAVLPVLATEVLVCAER